MTDSTTWKTKSNISTVGLPQVSENWKKCAWGIGTHGIDWAVTTTILRLQTEDRGGSRISFRRGCKRLLLYFNTKKPHSFFFFQNTNCIRKPQVISGGGGGAHPRYPPPRSAPAGAHDKCCDVQNNERTFMNFVQISKKAQRNWSTAGKQAFPLKCEQIGNWFVACAEFGRKATEKSAEKKQPAQPTPDIKRKKMKKPS